jgi:hypothetical protein
MLRFCRSLAWIAAILVALAFGVVAAAAQTGYPDRPVRIIVPIGPGGSYDLVGRHLADVLSKRTGQAFFVEQHSPISVRTEASHYQRRLCRLRSFHAISAALIGMD